jgi:hypothetical protein
MTTQLHPLLKPGYVGKLKNGMLYHCYSINSGGAFPVHGAYQLNGRWLMISHRLNGGGQEEFDIDLSPIELPDEDWTRCEKEEK